MKRALAVAAILAALFTAATALPASAATRPHVLAGQSWTCTFTPREYMLADDGMAVRTQPGTVRFSASHVKGAGFGRQDYEDAYLTTGWHDRDSTVCDHRTVEGTRRSYGHSIVLGRLRGPVMTASLHETGVSTRLGFDLWLTPVHYRTPTEAEHDRRTWEILVQPGRFAFHVDGLKAWHRAYVSLGGGNGRTVAWRGINLTAIAKRLHVPGGYWWNTIGAGGETPSGHFTLWSYQLVQHVPWWARVVVNQHPIITRGVRR